MQIGDKVVLNEEIIKTEMVYPLQLYTEYTISEIVGKTKLKIHGYGDKLFDKRIFKPREEFDFYYSFSDYHNFIQTMKAYLNSVPAGILREEAAMGMKGFWDFVDINYQRGLPEGSSLRTRSDKELGL
jgi:hypothetical protein